MFDASE
jgi:hypothetical protein